MKTEQVHIDNIRSRFSQMESKQDLADLLSKAKNLLYDEECEPVKVKHLTYYANPELCKKRYKRFHIRKKSGGERIIHAPVDGLKSILRPLNFVLQCIHEPHQSATGFVPEKSIVDNARAHIGKNYVLNLDLKDFFHSFDRNQVKMEFYFRYFKLNKKQEEIAFLLACLCTHPFGIDGETKTVLPQGSPTSPTLTNMLCRDLDRRLNGLAKRFGLTYTRYADDVTFSSGHNAYSDAEFSEELKRIIEEDQELVINPKKTRLQNASYRQEATGLIVNEKVNVRRRYVKEIRMWLYYWEKYGYEKAEQIFKRDYIVDKGHVKNMNAHLVNVLDGKLEFLKMVKGAEDRTYKGLKLRLKKLIDKQQPKVQEEIQTTTVAESKAIKVLHDPKFVIEKLQQFTADPIMKWLTHFWDVPMATSSEEHTLRVMGKYLEAVSSRRSKFQVLQKYNYYLWWKVIFPFVFQNKLTKIQTEEDFGWGKYNIQLGWQYPGVLKEWTKVNYDGQPSALKKTPFEMPVPTEYITDKANDKYHDLFGKDIKYFGDISQMFKREIEFREDTKDFYYEIKNLIRQELVEFNVNGLESLKQFSFFTYTTSVLMSIRRIFFMIQTRTEHRNINIECQTLFDKRLIEFTITHEGSHSNRESEDDKILNPSGDLLAAISNLFSLCDFEIESQFTDGSFRITYLSSDVEVKKLNNQIQLSPLKNQTPDAVPGFTYILKFPI